MGGKTPRQLIAAIASINENQIFTAKSACTQHQAAGHRGTHRISSGQQKRTQSYTIIILYCTDCKLYASIY